MYHDPQAADFGASSDLALAGNFKDVVTDTETELTRLSERMETLTRRIDNCVCDQDVSRRVRSDGNDDIDHHDGDDLYHAMLGKQFSQLHVETSERRVNNDNSVTEE